MPVIHKIFPEKNIRIYSRSKRIININGLVYRVKYIKDLLNEFDKDLESIIYIAIDCNNIHDILIKLNNIDLSKSHIVIDTPIIDENLVDINNPKSITVAEDFPFSPIGKFVKYISEKHKIIIFKKSFFKYHGASLLRVFFKHKLNLSMPFSNTKIFSFFDVHIFKSQSKFAIVIGKRNYKKGEILFLKDKKLVSSNLIKFDRVNKRLTLFNNVIDTLTDDEMHFLSEVKDKHKVFDNIEAYKRIGLLRLLNLVVNKKETEDIYSLKMGRDDYNLTFKLKS